MNVKIAKRFLSADEVLRRFIDFFESKNHYHHKPSPLLSGENDTTMFTIAGMKQFTDFFLGTRKPDYTKVITVQPCLRVNDLDIIGKSSFHHTFFEMLGSFSFNDYFKKDAISWAYEFLFEDLGINTDFIYVTVHKNDQEAYNLWKAYFPEERIIRSSHNIWKAGNSGPCGYCSEIFFDRNLGDLQPNRVVKNAIESSDQRFLEVWNLVFMEFQCEGDEWTTLARKSIDSGMGLERLCSILNGSFDTYKTDLIKPLMGNRIVADHSRAILFLCSEGLKPSSDGPGYVLRKLIRRSLVHGSIEDLLSTIEKAYYIYKERYNLDIQTSLDTVKEEYTKFKSVLEEAEKQFKNLKVVDEKGLFFLYETFGIPLDVTKDLARKLFIQIDDEKLEKYMENHRRISSVNNSVQFNKPTVVKCYDNLQLKSQIVHREGNFLVTRESCFYAQGGGQRGDEGWFETANSYGRINDTWKQPITDDQYVIVHTIDIQKGSLNVGDEIVLKVDEEIRKGCTRAHSSVHILGEIAMKAVNGSSAGSAVDNDSFHLDIECQDLLKPHLKTIVEEANEIIRKAIPATIFHAKRDDLPEDVLFLKTATYAHEVRVVQFGSFSKQLCGGTHVENTGAIGLVIITKETAVKKNVRRIYGLCGKKALEYLLSQAEKSGEQVQSPVKNNEEERLYNHFLFFRNSSDSKMIKRMEEMGIPITMLETETNSRFVINTKNKVFPLDLQDFITKFELKGYKPGNIVRIGSTKKIDPSLIDDYLSSLLIANEADGVIEV